MTARESTSAKISSGAPERSRYLVRPAPAAALAAAFSLLLAAGAAEAQTSIDLVSNLGTSSDGSLTFSDDIAQRFTTGSRPSGYKLTRVDIRMRNVGTPVYSVTVREGTSTAPSSTSVGTLTNPTLTSGDADYQFTTTGGGIDLKPDTQYWVMIDVSTSTSAIVRTTNSNDESGEAGWSISNSSLRRSHSSTGSWSTNGEAVKMRVRGYAKPATVSSATADGTTLILHFNGALDRDSAVAASAFTVTAGGADQTPTGISVGLSTVTLTLGTAVTAGQTVTVAYAKPATNPLQDTAGNEVAGFTGQSVTNNTAAAAVTGVAISSAPLLDTDSDGTPDTYGLGEKIRVQVTFGTAVTVTGTPRLKIKLVVDKLADYESGSGTKVLTFAYTVVAGNASPTGTAVVADTLELNGGTITSGSTNANLAHSGLFHDSNHKVDGSLTGKNAPTVANAIPDQTATAGAAFSYQFPANTFADADAGDTLTYTATRGDGTALPTWLGFNANTRTFSGTPAAADIGTVSVTVTASDGTDTVSDTFDITVAAEPSIAKVEIVSNPRNSDSSSNMFYGRGQNIVVAVTWHKEVTWDVSAAANAGIRVRLNIGGTIRGAELVTRGATSGTAATLWFSYTVIKQDVDTDGVAVATAGGRLALLRNGATLTDAEGRNANVTHAGLTDDANHKVDGSEAATANRAPTFDDGDPETVGTDLGEVRAITNALASTVMRHDWFSDPDGDPLTFTLSADRDDEFFLPGGLVYRVPGGTGRIFYRLKRDCDLMNLSPTPTLTERNGSPSLLTVVRYTASDPDGASVSAMFTLVATIGCASFSSATVNRATLDIVFEGNMDFPADAPVPPANEFEVKVDGTAVALAANAVSVSGNKITLTLAAPVTAGQQVTVSYNPGDRPGAVRFTDRTVTNEATMVVEPTAATANGRTVTLTFDRNVSAVLDSTNEERGSDDLGSAAERLSWAFSVQGAYKDGDLFRNLVPRVAISGSTVTLTLGSDMAFLPGKDVSVSYDAELAGKTGAVLRAADGNTVGSFSREMVANATPGTERPVVASAEVAGTELTLTFDRALDASSAPAGSRFQVVAHPVNGDGESRVIHGTGTAAVSGRAVTVTLASAVEQGETARATYRKGDEANPLRDAAGTNPEVESFGWIMATVMDRTAPKLHSAVSTASVIFLYYDEKLDTNSTPPASAFSVTVGTVSRTVTSVEVKEDAVRLVFGGTGGSGATTVSYTVPASANPVRDVAGNAAAAFSGQTAPRADTSAAPALTGVETNGDIVTLTFNRELHGSHVPAASAFTVQDLQDEQVNDFDDWSQTILSVAVRGSTVVLDVSPGVYACAEARMSYNKPATNAGALRNLAGGEAAGFSKRSITHLKAHQCVFNAVRRASMEAGGASGDGRRRMSMQFDRPLRRRSLPNKNAFAVTPQGGGAPIEIEDVRIPDDPTRLLMTLSRPLSDGERATASYRPRSGAGLTDTDGNILAPFSTPVENSGPPEAKPEAEQALTASFVDMPAEHNGRRLFTFELRFSEDFPGRLRYKMLRDEAFQVANGRVWAARRAVKGQNRRWTIKVRPTSFEDVVITLPAAVDCAAAGAVCTEAGRKLSETVTATVPGPAALSVADGRAREGVDPAVEFPVTLSRAVTHEVTVRYRTVDGTAREGEDYAFAGGRLVFAAGEVEKTVRVPVRDDALDEGEETFTLRLSNAQGAHIGDDEATGTITNADPLQKMWLSRFGRTVASHVTDAVSDRLANPLTGAQVTVGGQRIDFARTGDEAWLEQTLTSIARALGAANGPEPGGPGWGSPGSDPGQVWAGPGSVSGTGLGFGAEHRVPGSTAARNLPGRDLLLGSAFHLAREGKGGHPGLAAWGRVTVGGFDGEAPADDGTVRIDGNVTTGILGADVKWKRLLAGVAVSVSKGKGAFDQPGVDSGKIESTMTTVSPYARFMVTDRVSVWGLAGWGTGRMTIVQAANENQPERETRTDLEMRLAAVGGRGALLEADKAGGFDLALKADAFYVETESEAVSNEGSTTGVASRARLALEGSRAFSMDGGSVLTPGFEVGLRHDGGDAETGTGVELGGRLSWADADSGFSAEARVRALIAHKDSGYKEWGASGSVRLDPGERGRGLSLSLAPTWGAASSGVDRLWSARDARELEPNREFEAGQRLEGELGYGLSAFGDRFTSTPNIGFGLSDTARDYRIGWRLTSAVRGDPGFQVDFDVTRREAANGNGPAEHGAMLRSTIRW